MEVTVRRRVIKPEVVDFITKADQTFQLTQRERITLGLLAQYEAMSARELMEHLDLTEVESFTSMDGKITKMGIGSTP